MDGRAFGRQYDLQQLGQNAADTPHVQSLAIVFLKENDLRSAVESRADVAGELTLSRLVHRPLLILRNGNDLAALFVVQGVLLVLI